MNIIYPIQANDVLTGEIRQILERFKARLGGGSEYNWRYKQDSSVTRYKQYSSIGHEHFYNHASITTYT
jgi:hypothetical protein